MLQVERLKDTARFSFSGMGPQNLQQQFKVVVVEGWVGVGPD